MLEVFDRHLVKVAMLENAYERVEEAVLNGVGTLAFKLPDDDPKAAHLRPFAFLRSDSGAYYRILSDGVSRGVTGERVVKAEHAIATLVDDVMFGQHVIGNEGVHTRDVIEYILGFQSEPRWVLDACEFDLQYEYGLESENVLNALFSVPNLFVDAYRWEYDMGARPWKVSLRRIDTAKAPDFYVRAEKNLLAETGSAGAESMCTRLYLLGYGEGVNQLTIAGVNGGKPYLQSPEATIDRYGVISKVYVDRSFEDAQSLMERGRALLQEMQEPVLTRTVSVADLYEITKQDFDRAEIGGIVRLAMDDTVTYITGIRRNLDVAGDMRLTLATRPTDLARSVADIADRQRIEQVYSQGATQIYAQSIQANADSRTPAVLSFHIPRDMRIVNYVLAKIRIEAFRSYNKVTSGGGGSTSTSSAGGGGSSTSSNGGGGSTVTSEDGVTSLSVGTTVTLDSGAGFNTDGSSLTVTDAAHPSYGQYTGGASGDTGSGGGAATSDINLTTGSAGGGSTGSADGSKGSHAHTLASHSHGIGIHRHQAPSHTHGLSGHSHGIGSHRHYMSHTHSMWHQHTIPGHTHAVPGHSHRISIAAHSHSVPISDHSHSVSIPDHTHGIEQGIFRFGSPKGGDVYVNGVLKTSMGTDVELDLTEHLLGSDGKVMRGQWIRLGVQPGDLAYITIDLVVKGFVQSRGGGTY